MAIIGAKVKIYCNADGPIPTIDGGELKNNIPFGQEGRNSQSYYGDDEGGSNKIVELLWQPAALFGETTGRTAIKDKTLYYEFSMPSQYRVNGGIFGLGAGVYTEIIRSAWVSSEFCTDSEDSALSKYDKRTDKATVAQIKTSNTTGKPPVTGTGSGTGGTTTNKTLIYGGIGVVVLGFFIWFFGFRKS